MGIPDWVHSNMPSWNLKNNKQSMAIKPLPHILYDDKERQSHFLIYSLQNIKLKTIKFSWPNKMYGYNRINAKGFDANVGFSDSNYLKTERYLIEYNQISGQFVIVIRNQHQTQSIRFSYFDALPHFLKLYFHTMMMQIDGKQIDPFEDLEYFNLSFSEYKSNVVRIRNENPITMEWIISLKPNSELKFTMDIDKKFEHFESYPPDYNRGFDIGNGIINILDERFNLMDYHNLFVFGDQQNKNKYIKNQESGFKIIQMKSYKTVSQSVYTPQILVLLPYPDMSMVFNVIAFSSTLFAFFFGTAFNNLYRDVEDLDKRNFHALTDKLKSFISALCNKMPCQKCKKKKDKLE